MAHRFDPKNVHKLERAERLRLLPPAEILRKVGLGPGATAADVGAGSGYFTLPAAEVVGPGGKVYALDVSEEMLAHLRAKKPPPQVEVLLCSEEGLPLADGTVDLVFAAFVLHEVPDPVAFLREARRIARPGGDVAILDWQRIEEEEGPPLEHRLPPEEVCRSLEAAGLRILSAEPLGGSFYLVRARREEGA